MINDAWRKPLRSSQSISSCRQDGKQIQAEDADEKNATNVNMLALKSDGAVDEIQIIKIMNSSVALGSGEDEIAAVLIRQT